MAGTGPSGSWSALYAALASFLDDLEQHMKLENEVLFPQFENGARADG
ncbi:MAG: hemerythrin domain-containing protein [Dichotomicrobium sp.]